MASNSWCRPTNELTGEGRLFGRDAEVRITESVTTFSARVDTSMRAAQIKRERSSSVRSSASVSRRTVAGQGVRLVPRSSALTASRLMPARSASSSCVNPIRSR